MARLPYLDRSDLQPEFQDLLDRNINLYRLLAHSPVAAEAWQPFAHFVRHESRLDPRLRDFAILQVGYLERSAYDTRAVSRSAATSASATTISAPSPRKPPDGQSTLDP